MRVGIFVNDGTPEHRGWVRQVMAVGGAVLQRTSAAASDPLSCAALASLSAELFACGVNSGSARALCEAQAFRTAAVKFAAAATHGLEHSSLPHTPISGYPAIGVLIDSTLQLVGFDDPRRLLQIDGFVAELLTRDAFGDAYDLTTGWVGIGSYGLTRMSVPFGRDCVTRVIQRLAQLAVEDGGRVSFGSRRDPLVADYTTSQWSYWDLGIAHGASGVIAFLARAIDAGCAPREAGGLLQKLTAWMLEQRMPPRNPERYPALLHADGTRRASRLGWCYGDLAIGCALWCAAVVLQRADLAAEARASWRAAALSARRMASPVTPEDHRFCHGAAGIGHMLLQAERAGGDEVVRQVAVQWMNYTLSGLRRCGSALPSDAQQHPLLEGEVGMALALVASASARTPAWQEFLLAGVPTGFCGAFAADQSRCLGERAC